MVTEIETEDGQTITVSPIVGGVMLSITPLGGPTASFILSKERALEVVRQFQGVGLSTAQLKDKENG